MNCTGGAAGYIDRTIFGAAHIYQTPTCRVCQSHFEKIKQKHLLYASVNFNGTDLPAHPHSLISTYVVLF